MKRHQQAATDALAILDARYGRRKGWRAALAAERRRFAVGELIRKTREARGLTQQELAERACTSQSAIARIEDADYDALKLETLRKIAAALEVPLTISLGTRSVRLPVEKVHV